MIEKIREWNPRGNLRIKYKDDSGNEGVWEADQNILLMQIINIVRAYQKKGLKLTNRQLYYQLVSEAIIPNSEATYKRICTFLTDARYGGKIDWDAIEDRGRTPEIHPEWDSVKDLIKSAVSSYRLPRWSDQEHYVELYSEKQAMESVLKPVADSFHIYFGANKGYSSASTMYELAQRIKSKIEDGKKCVVLYLGDHDASGLDMVRDIRERITEFLLKSEEEVYVSPPESDKEGNEELEGFYLDEDTIEEYFQIVPLALNMTQIRTYNPPPNPAKLTDPRADWYIKKYGNKSWELDALKPEVLIDIAEQGILKYLDAEKYNKWVELEHQQKQKLKDFGDNLAEDEKK